MAESDKDGGKNFVAKRGALKGSLTRIHNKIKSGVIDEATMQMLRLLEEKTINAFGEYESINLELGEHMEDPDATETCYFECLAALRTRMADLAKITEDSTSAAPSSSAKIKLPHVNIQPFEGKYVEYRPFIELFNAFIHNDKNLSDIQKFFYLRGFLKGEAHDLVKNLPIIGSSYREALNILTERYDNKFKIIQDHLCALLDMPSCSKATAATLRSIICNTKQHLAALKNLGEAVHNWDSILVCLLVRKLDPVTANAYHIALNQSQTCLQPTYNMLIQFLEGRALALENSEGSKDASCSSKATGSVGKVSNLVNVKEVKCSFCGKSKHKIYTCPNFMLASTKERSDFVASRKLCRICLNSHPNKCKFHFKCQKCKQDHNTLLHSESEQEKCCEEPKGSSVNVANVSANNLNNKTQVLLPTAKVKLISNNGQEVIVKALLDSASQSSFVTSGIARVIGRPLIPNHTEIVGIANTEKTIRHALQTDIFSCVYPYKVKANLLVVDQITSRLPQCPIDFSKIKVPKNIKLADDSFHVTSDIDILLGADVFFQTLLPRDSQLQGVGECDAAQPRFVHTQFGYIVAGAVPSSSTQDSAVALFCQECETDISSTITNFWQTEKVPETFAEHTSEQQYCEKYFSETVKLENDRFEVSIPLKLPLSDMNNVLGDSLSLALKRFLNLEKKLQKDDQLNREYKAFIHEFLELGHGTLVDIALYDLSKDPVYFFAHHAVIKQDAITTKLRTVFDGSMKTSNKVSLNDLMLNGPIVQQELFDILLLFRLHKYFFVCDIRRMFRNINIEKDQRPLQNILWRDSPNEEIKCIQLQTVSYGLKSSSWLATRCLLELANRFGNQYPLAAPVLLNSTYVDDVLHTENSLSKLIATKTELTELLSKGSFRLHKWSANHKAVLTDIPEQQQSLGELELRKDIKALGLKFDIQADSFRISCPASNEVPKTKRQILSYISQFYDPLGLAGPVFVQAKVIMQKLWQSNVDWDSIPTPILQKEWLQFYSDLQQMAPFTIMRNACPENSKSIQIVGFADASIAAFGCAIYLRVIDEQSKVTTSLLCSKSRIAPKDNKLTIPRLELNAALLLAKLSMRVHDTLSKRVSIQSVNLFSDSQVVLAWRKTDPALLNAYVANRVKMINEYSKSFQWSYIKTDQNPADCLSRGIPPTELQCNQLWWLGPSFISDPNHKFIQYSHISGQDLPEVKGSKNEVVCAASHDKPPSFLSAILEKYSNINRAVNVLSYILRFCRNARPGTNKTKESFVLYTEVRHALHLFIKDEQDKYFQGDLALLQGGKQAASYLKSLNPFVDAEGILRVGGRLQHSSLPYSQRHQIILPKESNLTRLIIEHEHLKLFHAGQKLVLSSLQQHYWIVNGLRLVKRFIHKCTTCFRHKGITSKQLMGSLPADRVNVHRCFMKVGIDFAGPIMIKQSRVRNAITTKGYICVYVCFVTKAIHIELVSNLETETFLASFKRFIARRNVPSDVYCDNAGTFKAANTQLSELYKLNNSKIHQAQVQSETSKLGIKFNFIPSYSPVFAGLWESAVKSVKYHLKRVLGSHVLTYEELNTILVQIEGILNSRPITPMSSDIEDLSYLTPGHFLTGAPLNCIPEQDLTSLPDNRLNFWRKCTALKQHFWRYWSKQYLNVLQNRPKWKDILPNVKVGDLVILRELDTPPMTWPMARVTRVFEGHDGLVRALEVKKANGNVHKTSITKVCILPID